MKKLNKKILVFSLFIGMLSFFTLLTILFYRQAVSFPGVLGNYGSDIPSHIRAARLYLNGQLPFSSYFEPLFGLLIFVVMKSFFIDIVFSATIVLTFFKFLYALFLFFFLKTKAGLGVFSSLLLVFFLMICSSAYIPFFSSHLFYITGSPNIFKNPTEIILLPLSLVCIVMFVKIFEQKNICSALSFFFAILFFFSVLAKPSFFESFIPTGFFYLIFRKKINLPKIIFFFIISFPAALFFLHQSMFHSHSFSLRVAFRPLILFLRYSHHWIVDLFRAIIYPLSALMFLRGGVSKETFLAWIFFLVSYLQFALLVFVDPLGRALMEGNFGWGYLLSLNFLFVFSTFDIFKFRKKLSCYSFSILFFLMMLVFFSGVVRFVLLLLGSSAD